MQFSLDQIDYNFPKAQYREGQKEAIEFACRAFNEGKRVVILECPTGSGKSAIGKTLANMVPSSFYLTTSKILQDQLVGDFCDMVELKGRNAYPCTYWDRYGKKMVQLKILTNEELARYSVDNGECDNGFCRTSKNTADSSFRCARCFTRHGHHIGELSELLPGHSYSNCPYYEQLGMAEDSSQVVMNFSSFLHQIHFARRFKESRDLLIIDEAHGTEPQLLSFISIRISDFHLKNHGIFIPEFTEAIQYAEWFRESKVADVIELVAQEAARREDNRLADTLRRDLVKAKQFMDQIYHHQWVCEYAETKLSRSVTLKPVFANTHADGLLFKKADKILMMSATILDVNVICKSLGIDRSEVAAYRMKNRFPIENRPIYVRPVAKMTGGKSAMGKWAPQLLKGVDEIVAKYPDKRGIIHTHNFAIMDYLLQNSRHKRRFLDQRTFSDKNAMLEHHANSHNTVIVAPAMHEGIDLRDDLSRFQILAKTPYLNCFDDKQLAQRVEVDRNYYNWNVALRICQAYGRSIRSETDYADTYILDKSMTEFINRNPKMFPTWFTEALIY